MTGVIKVDDIQDAGANSIVSSNGSGTLTLGSFTAPNITASTAILPDASDGAAIGSASLEWSDLFLADGAVINFGDDQEVSLTHVADTGLLISSTDKLMFNDASQFIQGASATVLDIAATDEIELTATLIDVVGNLAVSGTLAQADALTMATNKKIIFRDAAIHISSTADGDLSIAADDEIDITSTLIDINGNVEVSGTLTQVGVATFTAALLPATDDAVDLGSASKQWRDIYTGDLNLNNTKHRKNEVDGTSGSWTIQEGSDDLFLLNRLSGKKYKFNLTEVK